MNYDPIALNRRVRRAKLRPFNNRGNASVMAVGGSKYYLQKQANQGGKIFCHWIEKKRKQQ